MPWKISYLEELKIIKTVYTDPIRLEELMEAVQANIKLAKEKQTHLFLGDSTAQSQSGSTMDIYQLGQFIESLNVDLNFKEAMVAPKGHGKVVEDLHFYETVTNNRMIRVRLFQDIETAIEWLVTDN